MRRKSDNALLSTYVYDAYTAQSHLFGSGRRIRRETTASANVGALVEKYFHDGQQCIEERRGTDTVQKQYVVGGRIDEWLLMERDITGDGIVDSSHAYHQNGLGSSVALTDSGGGVVERYTYGAYGRPLFENPDNTLAASQVQSGVTNPQLFGGYRFDPEAQNSYVRHRFLGHTQGRWLARDPEWPLATPAEELLSPVGYVNSDPSDTLDPYGRVPRDLTPAERDNLKKAVNLLGGTWPLETRVQVDQLDGGVYGRTVASRGIVFDEAVVGGGREGKRQLVGGSRAIVVLHEMYHAHGTIKPQDEREAQMVAECWWWHWAGKPVPTRKWQFYQDKMPDDWETNVACHCNASPNRRPTYGLYVH